MSNLDEHDIDELRYSVDGRCDGNTMSRIPLEELMQSDSDGVSTLVTICKILMRLIYFR